MMNLITSFGSDIKTYLLADDLHLSNRGSNRLVKNLGLITTNTNVTSQKKGKQQQRDKANTPTTNENRIGDQDNDDELNHEFWQRYQNFASCLLDYLEKNANEDVNTIIVYSDGCGYQNRNITTANSLTYKSNK